MPNAVCINQACPEFGIVKSNLLGYTPDLPLRCGALGCAQPMSDTDDPPTYPNPGPDAETPPP